MVKPLAGETVQTWHSLACAVKTEGKILRVCGGGSLRKRDRAGDRKGVAQSVGPALHVVKRSGLEMFRTLNT